MGKRTGTHTHLGAGWARFLLRQKKDSFASLTRFARNYSFLRLEFPLTKGSQVRFSSCQRRLGWIPRARYVFGESRRTAEKIFAETAYRDGRQPEGYLVEKPPDGQDAMQISGGQQQRAGIMVTHDLRMCEYLDRMLQMRDGKLLKEYTSREEIMELVKGGRNQ